MTPDRTKLPPLPKERDYAHTPEGAMEYARDLAEWHRAYTDLTDDHRKRGVEQWTREFGVMVAGHEADLQPHGSPRPGWVARDLADVRGELERFVDQVADDNQALLEDNRRVRRYLTWSIVTSASALISLAAFLAGQLILNNSGVPT